MYAASCCSCPVPTRTRLPLPQYLLVPTLPNTLLLCADNELSAFYHDEQQRSGLLAARAKIPPLDFAAVRKQRVLQYREAVAAGWDRQDKLGRPATAQKPHQHQQDSSGGVRQLLQSGTVMADVEAYAVPLPAAEYERFGALSAELVDEAMYYRLKAMA